jgi:hypothetical protein
MFREEDGHGGDRVKAMSRQPRKARSHAAPALTRAQPYTTPKNYSLSGLSGAWVDGPRRAKEFWCSCSLVGVDMCPASTRRAWPLVPDAIRGSGPYQLRGLRTPGPYRVLPILGHEPNFLISSVHPLAIRRRCFAFTRLQQSAKSDKPPVSPESPRRCGRAYWPVPRKTAGKAGGPERRTHSESQFA